MSARQALNTIARRRLVPPKPQKTYVKWYMNWADTAHKAVVLTCVGVTLYYGVGVVYMFFQSRKNKGELRRKLIEAGVIDEDGRQLMHRLQDEDSWLGPSGIQKRVNLAKKIEQKHIAEEATREKAEKEQLALEAANMDRARVGIYEPDAAVVEANRRRKEEKEGVEDDRKLDPRVGIFYRETGKATGSWYQWWNWKSGEQKQVEAQAQVEAGAVQSKETK